MEKPDVYQQNLERLTQIEKADEEEVEELLRTWGKE